MISTEQNTPKQLQRLGAQRQLYATAKKILGIQIVLSGPAAVLLAFLIIPYPAFKGYAALWGLTLALCDLFWLTPWQKRLRALAARTQEAFDCDVLALPWNELKADKRPDPEIIKAMSDKYQSWASEMPPLTDWYAPIVSDLPIHIGRIACQRSNCWWDSQQRRKYAMWVIALLFLVCFIVLGLSIINGLTLEDFVLKIATPLAPAILLAARQFSEQMETASRLDKLKGHAERLWDKSLSGNSEGEIATESRQLQDEILENRRKSPLVFDSIYKRLQSGFELQMNYCVTDLVTEAKVRLGL